MRYRLGSASAGDPAFGEKENALLHRVEVEQAGHEAHLVDRGAEEEPAETRESFVGKIAAPVEIVAPPRVAGGESGHVFVAASGKTARDHREPMAVGLHADEPGVGEKPRDAPVAVEKWMNPREPMMRRGCGDDPLQWVERGGAIALGETREEAR